MCNILIVEDDPMVAHIMKRYLERMERVQVYGPVTTLDGIASVLKRHAVDLILLEAYLPKQSGFDILKILRDKEYYGSVAMITAANSKQEIRRAYAYGVVDYIIKPFEEERLKITVMKHQKFVEKLQGKEYLCQKDLDEEKAKELRDYLPKGLNPATLDKIMKKLKEDSKHEWTIRELAKETQISNVTIKKYMDYMEQTGKIQASLTYGQIGRPEYKFFLKMQ